MELTEEEKDVLRKVMAHARSHRTEATAERSRQNGRKSSGRPKGSRRPVSPEGRANIRAAQAARREREALARGRGTENRAEETEPSKENVEGK